MRPDCQRALFWPERLLFLAAGGDRRGRSRDRTIPPGGHGLQPYLTSLMELVSVALGNLQPPSACTHPHPHHSRCEPPRTVLAKFSFSLGGSSRIHPSAAIASPSRICEAASTLVPSAYRVIRRDREKRKCEEPNIPPLTPVPPVLFRRACAKR